MAVTLFKDTTPNVSWLVDSVERGEIALPDLQRPFVWSATKVRDLFDSMYKGFPVGYLLFWETGAEAGARQIGLGIKQAAPRYLIVDGQQRLTSLFAVMTGHKIVREDFAEATIRIAFRPADATFAVTDAAIEKDPEFLPDISSLWQPGQRNKIGREFTSRLRGKREVDQDEEDRLLDALDRVHDVINYPFKVIELSTAANEEQVAEVFVRINSEGVTLNQADFILTLMSVFWDKGRTQLEEFCRTSRRPSLGEASPFNWYLQPQPAQLLRVAVAVAFRRAVLQQVYTVLRGRDVETGQILPEKRTEQFGRLQAAQDHVLNLVHWHEFLLCLERAGFRGAKMISSENAVVYTYALWLLGRTEYGVSLEDLRDVMARWFFMAHTTSRYSGSFETRVERDLSYLGKLAGGDAAGFVSTLDRIINDTLTADYWRITLPNQLASSAAKSPSLLAYLAALNILDADTLLSRTKIRSRLDPAITLKKGIERHHLFPRQHLRKKLDVTDARDINQIANMALVEWHVNIDISDQAPAEYWPAQVAARGLPHDVLAKQMHYHALPEDWTALPYDQFLIARRRLMAEVAHEAFLLLARPEYHPVYPATVALPPSKPERGSRVYFGVKVSDLIDAGLLDVGAVLVNPTDEVEAVVLADGRLQFDGVPYDTPSGASDAAHGASSNGWTYWFADTPDGLRSLSALREHLSQVDPPTAET